MRIEIHLPDDPKFLNKLQALADAKDQSRKKWMERLIVEAVNPSFLPENLKVKGKYGKKDRPANRP